MQSLIIVSIKNLIEIQLAMVKAKVFVYARPFEGDPQLSNFALQEEELPGVKDGEILIEALFISVDPYMRLYITGSPIGSVMIGGQVARLVMF